jgi:hypothetical protein
MNNTKTLAMFAVLMAATLVVVGTLTATTIIATQSALAYLQKKDDNKKDGGNNNGNTITIQKCKQAAIQSGWDNDQEQECENLICTHPGESATCTQEGAVATATATATPTPTPKPPTTGTLRVIKTVTCRSTDPNCSLPAVCEITVDSESSIPPTQKFTCQDALGNGVLVRLNPGMFNIGISEIGTPTFDINFLGTCSGNIAAGQELTCIISNTESPPL